MAKFLTYAQKDAVKLTENEYYSENWQSVLLKMLRFQRPLVANAQKMTQISLQNDPN